MSRDFTPPPIATKEFRGAVALDYSFQLAAELEPRRRSATPRGGRIYRALLGGRITGPRLTGTAYPHSGGDYGVVRGDRVEDVYARFMIQAANGEWMYVSHAGYRRPDGYHVLHAYFDADAGGPYAWLNDAAMLVRGEEGTDGRSATYTYYQAI